MRETTMEVPCTVGDIVYYLPDLFGKPEEYTVTEVIPYGERWAHMVYNVALKNETKPDPIRVRFDEFVKLGGKTVFSNMDEVNRVRREAADRLVTQEDATIKERILQCEDVETALLIACNHMPLLPSGQSRDRDVHHMLAGMFGISISDPYQRADFENCRLLLHWILSHKQEWIQSKKGDSENGSKQR